MLKKVLLALALVASPAFADVQNVGGFNANAPDSLGASAQAHVASTSLGGWQNINVFRTTAPASGILAGVMIGSQSGLTGAVTVYALRRAPTAGTTCTDNVAFALSNADAFYLAFPPITLTPATSQGVTQTSAIGVPASNPLPLSNADNPATTLLYVCVVANATITPATTSDLWITLSTLRD